MGQRLDELDAKLRHYGFYAVLHIVILLVSALLVWFISVDTFRGEAFYDRPQFMRAQFWVCMFFLADFVIEWLLSPSKLRYLWGRWLFLVVSIPWLTIIDAYGWDFSPAVRYVLRFIPLVRGGYALAIVVGWFTSSKATSLFWSYLLTLLATIYFASLAFFLFEHDVNKMVTDYGDALWWACMIVTTVGSSISAVTPIGRVLSVVLATIGVALFPIVTVYISNLIKNKSTERPAPLAPTGKEGAAKGAEAAKSGVDKN